MNHGFPKQQKGIPRLLTAFMVIPAMMAAVHYNTIVHPFTLADNRHYVFYAFRVLLRYHPAVKYAAALAYFLCAWAVISAFGFSTVAPPPKLTQVQPPAAPKKTSKKDQNKDTPKASKKSKKEVKFSANTKPGQTQPPVSPEAFAKIQEHIIMRQKLQPGVPHVSLVLVWLVATSLSLVTAPLVEPRYFIIPWVMWRLHIPQPTPAIDRQHRPENPREVFRADVAKNFPLFLETLWFLVINAATGYVFLYKGFEWPQEPGKIQRFMW